MALIRRYTQGDAGLWNSAARFYGAAVNDPLTASQMPMKAHHWQFLEVVLTELYRRGEVSP